MSKKPPPPPPPSKPKHLLSTSTTTTPTTTTTTTAAPSSKRGLGWPWDYPAAHFPLYAPSSPTTTSSSTSSSTSTPGSITWLFNWELWTPPGLPPSIEWVPCVRTPAQAADAIPFLTDVIEHQGRRVGALLGFNEPEIEGQANVGVAEALASWRAVNVPARRRWGLRLGSPGISSDRRGGEWLDGFLAGLREGEGEGVDFVVVHWYGRRWGDMRAFLEQCWHRWGLRLWVNEFACSSMGDGEVGEEEVVAFMSEAVPWLDRCEFVERYAYFGNGQGKTVGEWVGRKNDFCVQVVEGGHDGRALSRVGRLYTEL